MLSFVRTADNNVIIMLPLRSKTSHCGTESAPLDRGEIDKNTFDRTERTTGVNIRVTAAPSTTQLIQWRLTGQKKETQIRILLKFSFEESSDAVDMYFGNLIRAS